MINIFTLDTHIRAEAEVYDSKGNQVRFTLQPLPAEFAGLERCAARKRIAGTRAKGLMDRIKDHVLQQPYGDRGGVPIEPMC